MSYVKALLGLSAVSFLLLPISAPAAESHFKYRPPLRSVCTRRPLTSAEKAYFAHYSTLRKALPPTPAGWRAKDISWTPPKQECVQKDSDDYILAVDINYVRPQSAADHAKLQAAYKAKSPHKAELDRLKAQDHALFVKEEALRKKNAALSRAVGKQYIKTITIGNKVLFASDPAKAKKLQAAADAEGAKYDKMKAKLDKANAPLDKLEKQSDSVAKKTELLIDQDRVAGHSRRYDVLQDHSARVYVQLNVSSKNLIRLMNTPLHPESMDNPFVLCMNPHKMHVPGALYAWRCVNKDEYNNAGNLEERRGAMIVALFAKSKRDAPNLKYVDDEYYDRHFKNVQKKNGLLYIRPGKIAGNPLEVQNVVVVVESDNMARVNHLFAGMNLKPIAQLFH